MRRRSFMVVIGSVSLVFPATFLLAEGASRMLRIGMATVVPRSALAASLSAFVNRMAELGYHEGAEFTLEHMPVAGVDGYEVAFRELVARNVDILLVFGNDKAAAAARAAADGKPIVLLALGFDPIEKGFAKSLAHPGGNITGLFVQQVDLAAKRVELIHEAVPNAGLVHLLFDAVSKDQATAAAKVARRVQIEPDLLELTDQPDYAAALASLAGDGKKAVVIMESPLLVRDRNTLVPLLVEHGIPAIGPWLEDAKAGALLSYGVDQIDAFRRAADFVDRIHQGAKPSDLPIEQPARFQLAVNLKTAQAIGLTVPQSILARADEVIE